MKQLAEALKITAELTVQEWNDFGLAVTRMVDVHVNRQEGREEEKETEKEEEGCILTINRRECVRESEREMILQSTGREKQRWAGDSGGRRRAGGDGCVLTYTQHTHMRIGTRKHTHMLYARAMVG